MLGAVSEPPLMQRQFPSIHFPLVHAGPNWRKMEEKGEKEKRERERERERGGER